MTNLWTQIRDNWIILIFIGSLVVSWTNINTRIIEAEEEIVELHQVLSELQQIRIDVAVIKEKVSAIEKKQ